MATKMSMDGLTKTDIGEKEIEKLINDYGKTKNIDRIKLRTCKASTIGAGQGFTASVYKLEFEYEEPKDSNGLAKSAVLKVPSRKAVEETYRKLIENHEDDIEEQIDNHLERIKTECVAYKLLGEHSPIPSPVVYASMPYEKGKSAVIMMEDLGTRATTIGDATCTLSVDQLRSVTDVIADFHAWCLTTEVDWRAHIPPADGEHRKHAYHDKEFGIMKTCFKKTKSRYPGVFDSMNMEKAGRLFASGQMAKMLKKHSATMADVIVHGDLYANNLMFESIKDESTGKTKAGSKVAAVIDWPMAHRGCGMKDFATLLAFSVSTDLRRANSIDILRRYYDRVVQKAGADRVKASFDELMEIYTDQFVIAGMSFVFMLDWWQALFEGDGEDAESKRRVLFERALGVFEDMMSELGKADV